MSARAAGARAALLDRDGELSLLGARLDRLRDGTPGVVFVQGPPGSGRTALLQATEELAREKGIRVAASVATPFESPLPGAVAVQLLAALRSRQDSQDAQDFMAELQPERHVPELLSATVLAASAEQPLLLLVDDLQWADAESLALLPRLLPRTGREPVLLVVATDGTRSTFADAEVPPESGGGIVLRLTPLGRPAVRELIESVCATPPEEEFTDAAVRATDGNPALLSQALRDFGPHGARPVATSAALFAVAAATARARQVMTVLDALAPEALAMARALAACDVDLDFALVQSLAGPAGVGQHEVDLLCRAGLVADRNRPRLVDRLTAERVLANMPRQRREALCARAAELAHRLACDEGEVSRLVLRSPQTATGWPVPLLRRVSEANRVAEAPARAAQLLRRALREPVTGDDRATLLLDLAATEVARKPEAGDRALIEVVLAADDTSTELRLRAMNLLLARGDAVTAERVLELWRSSHPEHFEQGAAAVRWCAEDTLDGSTETEQGPLSDQIGDPEQAGVSAWRLAAAGQHINRVRALARAALNPSWDRSPAVLPRLSACNALIVSNDPVEAEAGLSEIVVHARRDRDRLNASAALSVLAWSNLQRGELDGCAAYLAESRVELPVRYWHPLSRPYALTPEILLAVERGRSAAAERAAATELPAIAERGSAWCYLLFARGGLFMANGQPEAAARVLLECGRRLAGRGWTNPALLPWRSAAAAALTAQGERERALDLLAEERELAIAWDGQAVSSRRPVLTRGRPGKAGPGRPGGGTPLRRLRL